MIPHLKDTSSTLLLLGFALMGLALFKTILSFRRSNQEPVPKEPHPTSELHEELREDKAVQFKRM